MYEQKKTCQECNTKSTCFKKLSILELEVANANRVELHYRKGENIAKQGSFVSQILYLQKGIVKVYMETGRESDMILNIFSEGSLIGLSGIFSEESMQYSVAALEDSIICAIDKKVIEDMVKNNGEFARSIIEDINRLTYYHFKKLIAATQKQLNGRMADALLHLSNDVYFSDDFNLALSRKELAELAGMSMMSAIRVIKDMQKNGIIEESNGYLLITDRQRLEEWSTYG
ncbi:Crp/Fnr family transcriptional regulator [Saccharicrinis sp. FJH62]|uniref:Crp/Fnr family transcriptional regulator n=1 Tax=Saccharicrinis sp. FJH62 TaxID=3344657 RepID=UPI0035D4D317